MQTKANFIMNSKKKILRCIIFSKQNGQSKQVLLTMFMHRICVFLNFTSRIVWEVSIRFKSTQEYQKERFLYCKFIYFNRLPLEMEKKIEDKEEEE